MVPPECWVLMGSKSCTVSSASMLESGTPHCSWLRSESPLITVAPQLDSLNCAATCPTLTGLKASVLRSTTKRTRTSDPCDLLFYSQGTECQQQSKHLDWWSSIQSNNVDKVVACHILSTTLQRLLGALQAIFHLAEQSPSSKRIWTRSPGMTCITTNVNKHLLGGLESYPHQQEPAKGLHLEVQSSS